MTTKTAPPRPWTVLRHGPIEPVEPNLWIVTGALPGSIPLERVMVIARLARGGLAIYNPIALDAARMATLDGLGEVAFVVVPNAQHRLDASSYAERYPRAQLLAPRGARDKIAKLVRVDGGLDALVDADVALDHVAGMNEAEAMMTVRSGEHRTIVVADALFNMPDLPGVKGWVLKHVTQSSGGPRVSRVARLLMIKDAAAFADQLDAVAAAPITRVVVGHHEMIVDDPAGTLRRIAATLR